ncbi:hypothetical protein BCL32_3973 [Rhizobium mongolense USDA 1844]|uniref:Uncharacterized protein n=1 Tax=Rhizobium mongolense USDA 1844 TaxID=1079460 RepID=A0A559SN67_9HYPH|nr:hypothetical protein BCL32_3973 [Rhizobium mongolense USDA 1844]
MGRYDGAEALIAVVHAAQVVGWILVAKPRGPVSQNNAAIDVARSPWARVVVGEEGCQVICPRHQFGHLIVWSRISGTRLQN